MAMDDKTVSLKEVLAEIDAMPPVKAEGHDFIEKTCLKTRLEFLPPAQSWWIPCSVMLPENDGVYLVTLRAITQLQKACAKIDIARFDGKWHKAYPVVAWMPLPNPWEGGQDG